MIVILSGTLAEWIVAVGTIIVAIVALFGGQIKNKLFGPKLHLGYSNEPPFCKFPMGNKWPSEAADQWTETWIYTQVKNTGHSMAKGVQVKLMDVLELKGNKIERLNYYNPAALAWANPNYTGKDYLPKNIAPSDYELVCVFQQKEGNPRMLHFKVYNVPQISGGLDVIDKKGTYVIKLRAFSETNKSPPLWLKISFFPDKEGQQVKRVEVEKLKGSACLRFSKLARQINSNS